MRAAAQLEYLARRHEVWCAGLVDARKWHTQDASWRRSLERLRSLCREVAAVPHRRTLAESRALSSLLTGGTATEGYFASPGLRRKVLDWAGRVRFDAVLAFSSSMAPLALQVPAERHVLNLDDLDSRKWDDLADRARWPMNWIYRTEAERLARRESAWLGTFDASTVISECEAALIDDPELRSLVHVIGPSLPDDEHHMNDCCPETCLLPDEPIVGFVGAMDYEPNVDAARWFHQCIWPDVLASRPDARWWIVGREPVRAIRRMADSDRVRVTGTVDEVEPYLARMRVMVAPLRVARGVQYKVLVAMRAGRPCIVTSCVAEGLGATPGRELVVADSAREFAAAVIGLLNDRDRAQSIANAGRAFASDPSRSESDLRRLEQLLTGDSEDNLAVPDFTPERVSAAACM
jgi:sugar transferase (PEP-CTERM/EpsH1 system associated)